MKVGHAMLAATSAGFVAVLALHAASPSTPTALAGTPTTTAPATTPTTAPASGSPRSATGASEQFGYGAISIKVTAQGSHVVAVSVASLQTAESYSQQLAAQVIPTLTSEALAAQSANIQGVSGASYTSAGFAQSLQSALSQLGL